MSDTVGVNNLVFIDQSIPESDHGHCWHPERNMSWSGSVQPLICCYCGFRAEQPHKTEWRTLDGHGPHLKELVYVPDGPVRRRWADSTFQTAPSQT
jgi:hypothetical protein